MKIEYSKRVGMKDEDLNSIESFLGQKLVPSIRTFLKENAGSIPLINMMPCKFNYFIGDGTQSDSYIEKILSSEEIKEQLLNTSYLHMYFEHFNLSPDFVEIDSLLPFANSPNGSVLISRYGINSGKIYYADSGDFGISFVSNDLQSLLDSMYH